MKRYRFTAFAAAAALILSLSACRGNDNVSVQTQTTVQTEVQEAAKTAIPEFAAAPMRDIPSTELVKEIKLGWNLGNTMDATKDDPSGSETPADWETCWGNPETTKKMIDSVKQVGFNGLRLPVTWDGKFGEGPDYKIDEAWLARVKEIADYAFENDMYVIINMHHEGWNDPKEDNADAAEEKLCALWSQIADYFEGYNEKLIFECMNEPRLRGTPLEWTGGDAASREIINRWNAAFVKTIRAKGGNNAKRHLMIPGYAASSSESVLADIKVPDDDKVIVSVHAYIPYRFALAEQDSAVKEWSADSSSDTNDIDMLMYTLDELFLKNGHAVIIGEMGARNRFNNKDRAEWAKYYIHAAKEKGIPCFWWDNNAFISGEAFGLLDRSSYEWRYPEIISAMNEAKDGE